MAKLPYFTSRAFLAPMAGISDPALRLICKELGAGLVITELTSIHAIIAKEKQLQALEKNISEFIEFSEKERPVGVQLFGSEIDALTKAAKIVEPFFDIIDYNMGCPAQHITCQMAGAALLQKPELNRQIFRSLVNAVAKPITLKMRAGVKKPDKFLETAKIAEEEGVAMIALHARTLEQGYSGKADWNLIKQLKETVSIPVVGNGDIWTPEDAKRMIETTNCDYVMLGRSACQNPFLFSQINEILETGTYKETDIIQRTHMFFRYLMYAEKYDTIKFVHVRMHAMNFTKGAKGGTLLRERIGKTKTVEELKELLIKEIIEKQDQ